MFSGITLIHLFKHNYNQIQKINAKFNTKNNSVFRILLNLLFEFDISTNV